MRAAPVETTLPHACGIGAASSERASGRGSGLGVRGRRGLVSFGPRARRRWLTCAMPLSCRQSLAAARCRLSPPPSVRPSVRLPFSVVFRRYCRFAAHLAARPCFPPPSDPSVCLLFPPLSSVPPFIFRFRFLLLPSPRSSLRPSSRFLPNWRSWQNRDVAARERGSRCQICRNGTTKPLRERALRHKSARRACDAFNSSCAEQLRTGVSCDGDEDTEGLAPAVAEMNRRSIFSSCHFGGFVR